MKSVLVVAAEAFELAGIVSRVKAVRTRWGLKFGRIAELNGMRLLLAADGPGPNLAGNAADQVGRCEQIDSVVSTGLCGALDPRLAVGDIFVADRVNEFKAELPKTARKYMVGRLFSADRVAGTVEEKALLRATGASVVEMEAAAIAGRAREWHKPFFCVRAVSDAAGEGFALDLNNVRDQDGRFSKRRILAQALRRPVTVLPELWRLKRNSDFASKALGEFFADCSF